jgi:hypothetical protein
MDVTLSLYHVNLLKHGERKSTKPNFGDNFKSTVVDLPLLITLHFTDQNSQQQHEFCDEILIFFIEFNFYTEVVSVVKRYFDVKSMCIKS